MGRVRRYHEKNNWITFIITILFSYLFNGSCYGSKKEATYFFHQQSNDMCMIAPMLNLKLLELMKNPDGSYYREI